MLIAHATDLSSDDPRPFAHAVALGAASGAKVVTVHARTSESTGPLPDVEQWLARWGLPLGSVYHAHVDHPSPEDPVETVLDALKSLAPDLVVCSTRGRTGLPRVLSGSIAEAIARNCAAPTLLIPPRGRGFVNLDDGTIQLRTVLIPSGDVVEAERALEAISLLAELAGRPWLTATLLHAEDGRPPPAPVVPERMLVETKVSAGSIQAAIIAAETDSSPDLIAMASRGHDGLLDVLFGSHTERVLHEATHPVLWAPLHAE